MMLSIFPSIFSLYVASPDNLAGLIFHSDSLFGICQTRLLATVTCVLILKAVLAAAMFFLTVLYHHSMTAHAMNENVAVQIMAMQMWSRVKMVQQMKKTAPIASNAYANLPQYLQASTR